MRKKHLLFWVFLLGGAALAAQAPEFANYFQDKTLRLSYYHCGNSETERYYFGELLEEPYWGGSKVNLIDTNFYGIYYLNLYDETSGKLIYSRGYNTLFGEWQTMQKTPADNKASQENVVMPFPKNKARIEICKRNDRGVFEKKFEYGVDPSSIRIYPNKRHRYPVRDVAVNGDPAHKVDIVLIPDGYTAEEMDKFFEDCKAFVRGFFSFSPFKESASRFNVRAVMAPSPESGVGNPVAREYPNTLLRSAFYTFDSERYIMTEEDNTLRDIASNAPYDFIYVIANSAQYGGGGIYNHYGLSVSGNMASAAVYVHEFGHLFAGLGDEYVEIGNETVDFRPDVEPYEANLTILADFSRKWKDMVEASTPIPTEPDPEKPWRIGAYEGGGYKAKGVYRPTPDCMMRTLEGGRFCPVCTRAILRQIDFYAK